MSHVKAEGTGERASEFLFRMAANPKWHPMDRKRAREVAYLFISYADQINQLREENERLVKQINDPAAGMVEVPF